ncbi:MAG: DUF998 domain-containing protein [Promethearchaeota archaeon]
MKKQELSYDLLQKDMQYLIIQFENEENTKIRKFWLDFSTFINGKAPLKAYILNLCLIFIVLGLILIIPVLLFPNSYSMKNNFISDLGVYSSNPQGAPIFNTGIIFIGILQIPFSMKLFQLKEKGDSKLIKISKSISIMGALGFIMVGIFPSNIRIPHLTGAFIVFFGYYLIANIDLIILIRNRKRSKELRSKLSYLGIFYIIFNLIAIQFCFTVILASNYPNHILHSYGYFSSSLWEWIFFLAIMSWSLVYFISNNRTRQFKSKILNPFFAINQKSRSPLVH